MSEAQYKNQKYRNVLRAAGLFTGMLALVLALGYILFGFTGMLWAGALGLITLRMSTRVSSQMIMRFQGGRALPEQQAPALHQLVKKLARRAKLPAAPKLYYVPSNSLNAFATGSKKDPAIAVTQGLLYRMDLRELSGILAHEISHIRNNDLQLKSMVNLFSRYTRFFSLFGQLLLFINLPLFLMGEATVSWTAIALLLFAPIVVALMVQAFSRNREYEADLEAARLTGDPNALADALEKLDYFNQGGWFARFNAPRRLKVPTIFSSHPEIEDRISRLRELAPSFVPRFDWAHGNI
ncbi:MAG: zinc metalloprotease HtpX [Phaeodactylibacter sp.]|uniref:zinc metalloprotease HtpX n=1 Tax=Phaeodactylibacter sp. TaxID=1940289 RepID=UPI0032EB6CCD